MLLIATALVPSLFYYLYKVNTYLYQDSYYCGLGQKVAYASTINEAIWLEVAFSEHSRIF